ncbi:MAG: lysophospholipid acyltransferase family protein [Candidatus Omnitrophota bacterium]
MKKILFKALYVVLKALVWLTTFIFFRITARGRENIPKKGPFIIVANHSSYLDPIAVQMVFSQKISWVTKKEVYNIKLIRPIHHICRSIVVNGAVDAAIDALNEGRVVGVFPEGGRSRDGKLRSGDVGAAIMALKTGMQVLPIGIKGAYEAYGAHMKRPRAHPIDINIGKSFSFDRVDKEKIESSVLQEKKERIIRKIGELL